MHGIGVGSRVDRDGRDAELLAGAQHAQRDLAAIGDQDFSNMQTDQTAIAKVRWNSA